MMREPCYRAWDKKRQIYGQVIKLEFNPSPSYREQNLGHSGSVSLMNLANEADMGYWGTWIENVELEEFIGLVDCTGQKVFEGDKLQRLSGNGRVGVVQFARGVFGINWDWEKNREPEWREGTLYGAWGSLHNLRRLDDSFIDELVVIGNIHETALIQAGGD